MPARVGNAVSLINPREVLSVGFVDIAVGDLPVTAAQVTQQVAARHSRIASLLPALLPSGPND